MSEQRSRFGDFAAGFALAAVLWLIESQARESQHRFRLALAEAGGRLKGAAEFSRELSIREAEQPRRRRR